MSAAAQQTTVYQARKILTMDHNQPVASHVAVRDGRILAVGDLAAVRAWTDAEVDQRFADKVLMPGLVEGHSHLMAGSLWRYQYCGYFDVKDPDGRTASGAVTLDAVVEQMRARHLQHPDKPVIGWGFDPIYFGDRRCNRSDLDRVSDTQPVAILHASGHILNVNSVVLQKAGLLREGVEHPAIPLGADGIPTGELKGPQGMGPAMPHLGIGASFLAADEAGLIAFGKLCVRAGVTTATDLAAELHEPEVATLLDVTGRDDYPVRLMPLLRLMGLTPEQAVDKAVALRARNTDQLKFGAIKIVADGSIQGFSARVRWPGYVNGAPNGLWYTPPDAVRDCYTRALQAGVQVHTHTNGDEATDMALDMLQAALRTVPSADHRLTFQHAQLADDAQMQRMKALGACANLFINHVYYWGEQHAQLTVGPERAARMNACASALQIGVPLAIHSDAPITPLAPLFSAWCAVNRLTAQGRCLGPNQRISVEQALYAITLGAAYTLRLDHQIGSIVAGKSADFCVLDDDPLAVDPLQLHTIGIWGTVQRGHLFAAASV